MAVCVVCRKGSNQISYSRHKKGSSGAGGNWALRAPIHKKTQKANLHTYKTEKFCTKCLRLVKVKYQKPVSETESPVVTA